MSTCPNAELYSAYFDNEVPAPWDKKMEEHVHECTACQKTLASFEHIHTKLMAEKCADFDADASYQKLLKKRETLSYSKVGSPEAPSKATWFRKKIAVPIPLAAAALALMLIIPPFMRSKQSLPEGSFARHDFKPILPVSNNTLFSNTNRKNRYAVMFNKTNGSPLLSAQESRHVAEFRISEFATLYLYKNDNNVVNEISIRMPVSNFATMQGFTAEDIQLDTNTFFHEDETINK